MIENNEDDWERFSDFESDFRVQFCRKFEQDYLYSEIHRRTQAEGEPLSSYITALQNIMKRMNPRPADDKQLRLVMQGLHPEYRDYGKIIEDLRDLRHFGEKFERRRER